MTNPEVYDALVIGGGVNGLAAAAYLARGGRHTLLVEARKSLGGLSAVTAFADGRPAPSVAHTLYALDPRLVTELKLARHGLKFVLRDAPSVLLREGAHPLIVGRDSRATARSIATHAKADAEAWPTYRSTLFALGRSMRAEWWEASGKAAENETIQRMTRTGAAAWLDSWFESDALKTLLAFDASLVSPLAAGSSLLLLWRAAQEMCGLQGATAFPAGGLSALVAALTKACESSGVTFCMNGEVAQLTIDGGRIAGARLVSGETIVAPIVLSSLSRASTMLQLANGAGLGLAERFEPAEEARVGTIKIHLALDRLPERIDIAGLLKGRLVLAEGLESYATAHAEARAGRIPDVLVLEAVFPTVVDPSLDVDGGHTVSILVRPLPLAPAGGWDAQKAALAAREVSKLNACVPGLVKHIVGIDILTPDVLASRYGEEFVPVDISRMLMDWPSRVRAPIEGLFLCGADADVVPAVSGRAGRIAASLAMAEPR